MYHRISRLDRRRRISQFTLLLMTVLLLGACSSSSAPLAPTIEPVAGDPSPSVSPAGGASPAPSSSSSTEVVRIGFGAQEYERQTYEPLIAAFNRENPDVQVQFVSLDEIMNGGAPGQAYDANAVTRRILSTTDTAVIWSISPEWVKYGYVRDLKPLMDADPTFDRADFFTTGLSVGEISGGTYLLPRVVRYRLLSYNKDLWTSQGVAAPKPDWTWNDMLKAAEQFGQKRGNNIQTYGFMDLNATMTVFFGELKAKGIDLYQTPTDQVKLDEPQFAEALDRVKSLVDSGAIFYQTTPVEGQGGGNPFQLIIEGQQAAMWAQDMVGAGPDGPKLPFAVGLAPYPQISLPFFDGGADGYMMSAGTQHPTEAWRWLSYLSQQEIKFQTDAPTTLGVVQARKSVTEKSGYWNNLDADAVAAATAALDRPVSPPLSNNQGPFFEPISMAIQSVLTGKQGSTKALAEAQQTIDQMLAQASASPSPSAQTGPPIVELPAPDIAPAGATQITFGSFGSDPMLARRLAREFNQTNQGVFVQVKDMAASVEPVTMTTAAGQVDCFSWYSAPDTKEMTATLDLNPLIDADPSFNLDDYPVAVLAPFKQGNALHGLPQSISLRVMSYNQTAFEAANINPPSVDWTVQEFVQAAEQLTTGEGDQKQYGYIALGTNTNDLMFFINRLGGTVTKGSGDAAQPNFVDGNVRQGIQLYLDLLRKASPHTKFGGYSRTSMADDVYNLLSQGRVGMWFDGGFSFTPVGPDGQPGAFTIATAPLPLNGRPMGPEDLTGRGMHISANSQNAQACWTWMKHLSNQVGSFDGMFPARKSLVQSETFKGKAPAGAVEVYNAYAEALAQTPQLAEAPKPFYMSKIEFYWFFRAVDRALQGEDLERELAEAQEITEQYVACVQAGTKPATCTKQVDPKYEGFIMDEPMPLPQGR